MITLIKKIFNKKCNHKWETIQSDKRLNIKVLHCENCNKRKLNVSTPFGKEVVELN